MRRLKLSGIHGRMKRRRTLEMVKFQMTSGVLKLGENLENIEESRRIGFLVIVSCGKWRVSYCSKKVTH